MTNRRNGKIDCEDSSTCGKDAGERKPPANASACKTAWERLVAKTRTTWHNLLIAISYYASMRVIFHTELALIMLSLVDLTINSTALIILLWISSTKALDCTAWAVLLRGPELSCASKHFWDELFTVIQALYLIESMNRIYYCLKLAYHHDIKMKEGDLCCMKCHEPLMSATISSVFAVPHFLSAMANIVYFIFAYRNTAVDMMDSHMSYFAKSPFVDRVNSSSAMETSMYYKLATQLIANDIAACRLSKNETMKGTVRRLLNTGSLDAVVDYKCALSVVHCRHARYYLQLTFESVLALINYTVIRALFSHVINMHQYEVYNQQTRLQAGGGSRIIRVYKVRHRKARRRSLFSSGIVQLPRQALMSLINLGYNLSVKMRRSSVKSADARLSTPPQVHNVETSRMSLKDVPVSMPIDDIEEQLLNTVDTESDYAAWYKQAEGPAAENEQQTQQPSADEKVFNRRGSLVGKKVNFQHYKISNLIPQNEDPAGGSSQPVSQTEGVVAQTPPPVQSTTDALAATSLESLLRVEAESYDSGNDSPKDLVPVGKKVVTAAEAKKGNRNDNDTIFTDETFYSLET